MTTPQNHLSSLADKIQILIDMFEEDENGNTIFDTIRRIEILMSDIMVVQQRQENLMNLIVKLLSKNDK
jgi:aspartate carbamoyltransferase catalytic subunit